MSVISIPGIIRGGTVEKYGVADRITCTVGAAQACTGGLLVEAMAGDRVVRTAQVNSAVCWGVAIHDQPTPALAVTVAAEGVWMLLASGAIGAGNKTICGAAGVAVVAGAAPDARFVNGRAIADIANAQIGPVKLTV